MKLKLIPTPADYVEDKIGTGKNKGHDVLCITMSPHGVCLGLKEALKRYASARWKKDDDENNFNDTLEEYVKWRILDMNGIKEYPIKRTKKQKTRR